MQIKEAYPNAKFVAVANNEVVGRGATEQIVRSEANRDPAVLAPFVARLDVPLEKTLSEEFCEDESIQSYAPAQNTSAPPIEALTCEAATPQGNALTIVGKYDSGADTCSIASPMWKQLKLRTTGTERRASFLLTIDNIEVRVLASKHPVQNKILIGRDVSQHFLRQNDPRQGVHKWKAYDNYP